jgi:hypothetical protein
MARRLPRAFAMKSLSLLLLLTLFVCAPWQAAHAQDAEPRDGAIIESVDLSGLPRDSLSPGLRRELDTLNGEPLSRQRLADIAARIEGEHPDIVAAVRYIARPNDRARVILLLARISDDESLVENINTRYTVESVEIHGIPEDTVTRTLRDRLQALVGRRLDHDEADELSDRLEDEHPGYEVERRISRGSERGRIRVVFEFNEKEGPRWLPFSPTRSKFVVHSTQGFSGFLDIPMGNRDHRFTLGVAASNNDDLIEEYSGISFGFESRRLGMDRLGAKVHVARFNTKWRDATLSAIGAAPAFPELYRDRVTVEPSVTFAITPYLRVTGGASISELESLAQSPNSQMASALVARVDVRYPWDEASPRQRVEGSYELRSATEALESDLFYKRHVGTLRYRYKYEDNTVISNLVVGGITGDAPLFERFSLGDTATLRGWNKYDLAPLGGDRVFHHTLEYRYHNLLGVFLDTGSVWERNTDMRIRFSTGFGLHGDNGFVTLGFPLNTDDVRVMFMAGVRF